jgi:hypothetical protein
MAQTVRLKRSAVAAKVPLTTDLALGELAVNTWDGVLYTLTNNGANNVVQIGGQSVSPSITAGTSSQGQSPLTANLNIIIVSPYNPSGVTLPSALLGNTVTVVNKGSNPVRVYPFTGNQIDTLGSNTPITLAANGVVQFNASSTTQWYSFTSSSATPQVNYGLSLALQYYAATL